MPTTFLSAEGILGFTVLLWRAALAWIASIIAYLVVTFSVVHEGFESFIGQPLVAGFLSAIAIAVTIIAGLPLYIPRVKKWWLKFWWISALMVPLGWLLMFLAWHPRFNVLVFSPDSKEAFHSFNPLLSFCGWFTSMFGMVHCPVISVGFIKNWISRYKSRRKNA